MPAATSPADGPAAAPELLAWDLFCRVVDNHGDLGVCWRLARDLAQRGQRVRLWVDDARALAWMAPDGAEGVSVRPWRDPLPDERPGDVVIEAFGCDPPEPFVRRMATRPEGEDAPLWLNLEYLSAEAYVERSHGLPSPQWSGPGQGLTKWFYYPGFTPATGGLLREAAWLARRDAHDGDAFLAQRLDLRRRGHAPRREAVALLFGYAQPALPGWLGRLADAREPLTLLVTPGHSAVAVSGWLGLERPPPPGSTTWRGPLRLRFLPHVDQQDFDRLLWSCDLNLVRGEDSVLRALWAGRPFLWQLYAQDDRAHLAKLDAFLHVYLAGAPAALAARLERAFQVWNDANRATDTAGLPADPTTWRDPLWCDWASRRSTELARAPDLTTQLLAFVARHRAGRPATRDLRSEAR